MREATLWRGVLGIENTVVETVGFDEVAQVLVASVRPTRRQQRRCGLCRRRGRVYDRGRGRRRWRALDSCGVPVWLEADAPRVRCPEHGVVVAHVPWARHDAGHTHTFDQTVAWLATRMSKTAVTELMRVAWRTVGSILERVWADVEAHQDRFEGLRRIGIDEISYRRGYKYLMVVVDHDTGRLVWAAPGRSAATLQEFFDLLGPERCAKITHVSADGADFIAKAVATNCSEEVVQAADPFHVVRWAVDALDEVRRTAWRDARARARATEPPRRPGRPRKTAAARDASDRASGLRSARFALWKNPDNLTGRQRAKIEWIARTDPDLYLAYQLKEHLRLVFALPHPEAAAALEDWMIAAADSGLAPFEKLANTVRIYQGPILAAIEHDLSNGRVESVNTKIRLITRIAFGFHTPQALIALAMLSLGGHRPVLPRRN